MDEKDLEGLDASRPEVDGWEVFWVLFGLLAAAFLGKLVMFLFIYISKKFFNLNSELQWVLEMLFEGVGFVFGVVLFYNVFFSFF